VVTSYTVFQPVFQSAIEDAFGVGDVPTFGLAQIAGTSESIGVDEFAEATQKDRALSVMAGLSRSWSRFCWPLIEWEVRLLWRAKTRSQMARVSQDDSDPAYARP
jgi:hypothetical protein